MNARHLLACLGVLLPGCSYYCYEAGAVRRVEVERKAEPTVLSLAEAAWTAHRDFEFTSMLSMSGAVVEPELGGAEGEAPIPVLQVSLWRTQPVELARSRRFTTIEWEASYHPLFPVWELLELATSPIYLLIIPALAIAGEAPTPDIPTFRSPAYARLLFGSAPINPFVSMFGVTLSRRECVEDQVFEEPLTTIRQEARLPATGVDVRWRLLRADGSALASGQARSDALGEITIAALTKDEALLRDMGSWAGGRKAGAAALTGMAPGEAAVVEVEAEGKRVVVGVPPVPKRKN